MHWYTGLPTWGIEFESQWPLYQSLAQLVQSAALTMQRSIVQINQD